MENSTCNSNKKQKNKTKASKQLLGDLSESFFEKMVTSLVPIWNGGKREALCYSSAMSSGFSITRFSRMMESQPPPKWLMTTAHS